MMQVLVKSFVGAPRRRDYFCRPNRTCEALLQGLLIVVVLAGLYLPMQANADEIRPALLDIKEQNTGLFAVTWKVPTRGDRVLAITPKLPESLELVGSPTVQDVPGARIEHFTFKSNGKSLSGESVVIEGLSAQQTDVLLLIQLQDGTQHSAILRPASPEYIKASGRWRLLAYGYHPYPGRG